MLRLTFLDFVRKYCEFRREKFLFQDGAIVREFLALRKKPDNRCFFLDGRLCAIQNMKPFQCSQAPFVSPIMKEREVWGQFSQMCEGLGAGRLMSYSDVERRVKQYEDIRTNYLLWLEANGGSLEKGLGVELGKAVEIEIAIDTNVGSYRYGVNKILPEVFHERRCEL